MIKKKKKRKIAKVEALAKLPRYLVTIEGSFGCNIFHEVCELFRKKRHRIYNIYRDCISEEEENEMWALSHAEPQNLVIALCKMIDKYKSFFHRFLKPYRSICYESYAKKKDFIPLLKKPKSNIYISKHSIQTPEIFLDAFKSKIENAAFTYLKELYEEMLDDFLLKKYTTIPNLTIYIDSEAEDCFETYSANYKLPLRFFERLNGAYRQKYRSLLLTTLTSADIAYFDADLYDSASDLFKDIEKEIFRHYAKLCPTMKGSKLIKQYRQLEKESQEYRTAHF